MEKTNNYIKLSEFDAGSFQALPICSFNIYQNPRRNTPGLYYYSLLVKLDEALTLSFDITQAEYFLLENFFKLPRGQKYHANLKSHFRLVGSTRDDGSKYVFFESIFMKGIYRSAFLKQDQLDLIDALNLPIKIDWFDKLKEESLQAYGGDAVKQAD